MDITKTNKMERVLVENVENRTPTTLQRNANCGGNQLVYAKTCKKWKREKKILSVKYTRNISFLEAQRIVNATNRDKTHSQAVSLKTNTELTSKYQNLVRKLLELRQGTGLTLSKT